MVVTIMKIAGSTVNQAVFFLFTSQAETAISASDAKSWLAEPKIGQMAANALV